jgi:hypothetical protein
VEEVFELNESAKLREVKRVLLKPRVDSTGY